MYGLQVTLTYRPIRLSGAIRNTDSICRSPISCYEPVRYRRQVAHTRKLLAALSRRGPHRVLRGDLSFAGLPGVVYTPAGGLNLPGVAFGHDWLTGTARYAGLLEHLASWGIVTGAPDTQRGLTPSVLNLAFDLGSALDIVAGVRLGPGNISVHPAKLGLVGHGFGGSAAVLAAAGLPGLAGLPAKSAVAIFPTVTSPAPEQPAATCKVPGLILTAPGDPKTLNSNALSLYRAWDDATLRIVSKAKAGGLVEGWRMTKVVGLAGPHRATQKAVRSLLTGYLLYALGGDKEYRDFADPDMHLPHTVPVDPEAPLVTPEQKIVTLLK
uniref:B229_F1_20 n=1 Tax=Mycobacterium leprae TaxID=1769 RepID=Q49872_MYCLR|nr:B229_F1_20 [Mycobacterium leprae]